MTIPIAFKLIDRFTNPASTAIRLQNVGVNGLILFAHRLDWDADVAMVVSEIYRQGANSIDVILAGVRRFLDTNHYHSIESFVQSRSNLDNRPSYEMRSEVVDPLTSPSKYQDPTPVKEPFTWDRYGHPSE